MHAVLLGDSIFDNQAYVGDGPDVVTQLRGELPYGWKATLLARDGDLTAGVIRQLESLPPDSSHLVVSVGGNDALGFAHLLATGVASVAEALALLGQAQDHFASGYAAMIDAVAGSGLATAVCTIYDTPPSAPGRRVITSALALFNDQITRAAFSRGISLIDLRLVCDEDNDYANPIEPSVQGGMKIAKAIGAFLLAERDACRSGVIGGEQTQNGW